MTKYPNNSVGVLAPWIYKMLTSAETGYKCIYLFCVLELSSQFVPYKNIFLKKPAFPYICISHSLLIC